MVYKDVSITVCDDCLDVMDVDRLDDSKRVRRRDAVYYGSVYVMLVGLVGLFYWCYIVMADMDEIEGDDV